MCMPVAVLANVPQHGLSLIYTDIQIPAQKTFNFAILKQDLPFVKE